MRRGDSKQNRNQLERNALQTLFGNIVSETTNREEGRRIHGARDAGERWQDSTKRKASITADAERKQGTGNTRRRQIEAITTIGHTAVWAFWLLRLHFDRSVQFASVIQCITYSGAQTFSAKQIITKDSGYINLYGIV